MKLTVRQVDWEYASVFRIAYSTQTHARTVIVEIEDDSQVGRGEAMGVFYHGESIEKIHDQLMGLEGPHGEGLTRAVLEERLPAGGVRNALDCALWDLDAKRAGKRAWELAGLTSMRPIVTDFTLGLDTPQMMARAAAKATAFPVLKLKMDGNGDLDRLSAIRQVRPDARFIVDANQAWSFEMLREMAPRLAELNVVLIEQPLPEGKDEALAGYRSPVPLCADESCQTSASIATIKDKYQYANIKLDKTGGLTEALRLAHAARAAGLKLMVGCMGGSSLAMAPAFIIGQLCEFVDLDGPLLLKNDIEHGILYEGSRMHPPDGCLWG